MKKILILSFIIFSLVWGNFYISCFGHYHVAADGTFVFHSHPYQKNGKSGSLPTHSHSQAELAWTARLIHILSLLFFYSIFLFLFLQDKKIYFYQNERISQQRFQTAPFARAPPFLLA